MADPVHLAILRQGVEVWNAWLRAHADVTPDLQHANFREADLFGVNLGRAILTGSIFTGARLQWSTLTDAILPEVNLQEADLTEANLTRANLTRALLYHADLTRANLTQAILDHADLQSVILHSAILHQADLRGVTLHGADLTEATLTEATLSGANLTRTNFQRARLERTNLTHAYTHMTIFGDLDLRTVRGLETLTHWGPSTLGIDTLYTSHGDIPEVFLRGCGVSNSLIDYARSLVVAERPIDYYSCFISYASPDHACALRLHTDLQARGVRCWFAPHNLEIGTPIVQGIDEAIRLYDKLLIILSEASVKSRWVEFEVAQALHREIEQGRTVLFPIRLDDTVLHTPSGWAAQLHTRHIGDFRHWKEHDTYQVAFARLLRDLKAEQQ